MKIIPYSLGFLNVVYMADAICHRQIMQVVFYTIYSFSEVKHISFPFNMNFEEKTQTRQSKYSCSFQ